MFTRKSGPELAPDGVLDESLGAVFVILQQFLYEFPCP